MKQYTHNALEKGALNTLCSLDLSNTDITSNIFFTKSICALCLRHFGLTAKRQLDLINMVLLGLRNIGILNFRIYSHFGPSAYKHNVLGTYRSRHYSHLGIWDLRTCRYFGLKAHWHFEPCSQRQGIYGYRH